MAIRDWVRASESGRTQRIIWSGLLNGDTGKIFSAPGAADMTVQAFGTFGSGGTVIMQGTLEELTSPTNFFTLRDGGDNLISFGTADAEMIAMVAAGLRPSVTAGDGTTDLTVILFVRSTMR